MQDNIVPYCTGTKQIVFIDGENGNIFNVLLCYIEVEAKNYIYRIKNRICC